MTAIERIEDLVPDRFGFVNQDSGRGVGLIVQAFDVAACIGGAAEEETA